ncbi:MAG: hypothetical protein ACFCVA_05960 [Gammaproteobacteria bacterium]
MKTPVSVTKVSLMLGIPIVAVMCAIAASVGWIAGRRLAEPAITPVYQSVQKLETKLKAAEAVIAELKERLGAQEERTFTAQQNDVVWIVPGQLALVVTACYPNAVGVRLGELAQEIALGQPVHATLGQKVYTLTPVKVHLVPVGVSSATFDLDVAPLPSNAQ